MTRKLVLEAALNNMPPRYKGRFAKACSKSISPARAIRAKCEHCVGYEDVAERISTCTTYACPLWRYRPYQKGEEKDDA